MVGRTPEYLGKKIEAYEMKMASLVILIPCFFVLVLAPQVHRCPSLNALRTWHLGRTKNQAPRTRN